LGGASKKTLERVLVHAKNGEKKQRKIKLSRKKRKHKKGRVQGLSSAERRDLLLHKNEEALISSTAKEREEANKTPEGRKENHKMNFRPGTFWADGRALRR